MKAEGWELSVITRGKEEKKTTTKEETKSLVKIIIIIKQVQFCLFCPPYKS